MIITTIVIIIFLRNTDLKALNVISPRMVSNYYTLAAQPAQADLRDKTWKETIFKIIAGRINVSISTC